MVKKTVNNNENWIKLEDLNDQVKALARRVDTVQTTVDLLYKDREILEDMQGSIRKLQELIILKGQHSESALQDVKADVKDVQTTVEQKVNTVEDKVDEVKDAVQDSKDDFLEMVGKKKIVKLVVKKGSKYKNWFEKLLFWLR